ncbi:MAG: hypothetical protein AB8H47_15800 [Bacteroidia bacterium]
MKKTAVVSIAQAPHPEQILGIFNDFTLEVCMNESSKNVAFQIRYCANLETTGIQENEGNLLYDSNDFLPYTRIFLVWYQGRAVATLRSCAYAERYDWYATEATNYFQSELDQQLGCNTSLLEANRFAVLPEFQGSHSLFACKLLFRAHAMNAAVHRSEYIVHLVRLRHQAFYKRFFGMEVIARGRYFIKWAQVYADSVLLAQKSELALSTILKRGMPAFDQHDIDQYIRIAELASPNRQRLAA